MQSKEGFVVRERLDSLLFTHCGLLLEGGGRSTPPSPGLNCVIGVASDPATRLSLDVWPLAPSRAACV